MKTKAHKICILIIAEQYHAVEYVENYYIGRALSQADQ